MSEPKENDGEHAREMLAMARKDLRALEHMQDAAAFEDEIFGFHAQQAIEKTLKAWMAHRGLAYPLTHNLEVLLTALREEGAEVDPFWTLERYTDFAVMLRYEALEKDMPEARPKIVEQVKRLVQHVDQRLAEA